MTRPVCTDGLHGHGAAALTCAYAVQVPQSHVPVAPFDLAGEALFDLACGGLRGSPLPAQLRVVPLDR
jgi:hypothetical protein